MSLPSFSWHENQRLAVSIFCAGDLRDYSHQYKRSSTTPNTGRQPFVPAELTVTAQAAERVDLPAYIRGYTNSVTLDTYTESKTLTYTKSSLLPLITPTIFSHKIGQNLWIKATESQTRLDLQITVNLQAVAIHTEVYLYSHNFSGLPHSLQLPHAPIVTVESVLFVCTYGDLYG